MFDILYIAFCITSQQATKSLYEFIIFRKGQVNSNVWNKAQPAIYKKVEYEMTSYSRLEKNHVSQLEIALSNVHLKLEEEARKKLNRSFPNDMEVFKNALDKLFIALDLLKKISLIEKINRVYTKIDEKEE
ncbi:hypothetical protein GLOIN_2v1713008 [Rhizophagus irregularis DAOM 181602=DAOM 197198]|nr:hypothetical protein GLOIN_2v1713008 [Rhizophagus irregularis DAOM 181602=DAOM 197198]